MSIKFIFMALTYNVWPSIAIVTVFFGSFRFGTTKSKPTVKGRMKEREKGKKENK